MIEPGARLGAFAISEIVGAGGMGLVYRATDTVLGRGVAIKVLPASLAQDSAGVERFEREARVLAALNHINIAQIHGLEKGDNTLALVMELVEGETLAEKIQRGPIQVDEAVDIAVQIAEALEAAHSRGIVHRDLKPANIKLRPDGVVKVLDFGIARILDDRDSVSEQRMPGVTEIGTVLSITTAPGAPIALSGGNVDIAIAPRGDSVVFSANDETLARLHVRAIGDLWPSRLQGFDNASAFAPFFSPDGEWVAFNDQLEDTLVKVPIQGGPPIRIADVGSAPARGAFWGADGTIFFGSTVPGGLWSVSANGGEPKESTVLDVSRGELNHVWPSPLPGGRRVLFTVVTGASA